MTKNIKGILAGLCLVLLLGATLATSGCMGLTVYSSCEEIYPECVAYYGNIQNPYNVDDDTGTYAQFPKSSLCELTFENVYDRITIPTDTRGQLSIRFLAADMTSGSGGAVILVQIYRDTGSVGHKETLVLEDYDGYSHWVTTTAAPDFTYFDTNGDGKIKVKISHPSTDANTVNMRSLKYRVDKIASTSTTTDTTTDTTIPTTTTGTGTVYFWSDPYGASVYVDGSMKGTTAALSWGKLVLELSPGSHTWKMEKSGYASASGTVSVEAGGVYDVFGALTQLDSGTSATDDSDDSSSDTSYINTEPSNLPPVAEISQTQPATNTIMFSSAESYDSDGVIVSRSWIMNGQAVGTNTVYTFTAPESAGTYEIVLTVTDNDGASSQAKSTVTIQKNTVTDIETVTDVQTVTETVTVPSDSEDSSGGSGNVFQVVPGFGFFPGLLGLLCVVYLVRREKIE